MDEKIKKYHELLNELDKTVADAMLFQGQDVDVEIETMIRNLRQYIERFRRVKDGESLTYEDLPKEEPKI